LRKLAVLHRPLSWIKGPTSKEKEIVYNEKRKKYALNIQDSPVLGILRGGDSNKFICGCGMGVDPTTALVNSVSIS